MTELGTKLICILDDRLPQVYYAFNRMRIDTGAFDQLTRKYLEETFNPNTPDVEDIRLVLNHEYVV